MSTRESVDVKGARYLLEGRLTITRVDGEVIEAECRGIGEVYRVGHHPRHRNGWWCSCPARGRCSHLAALMTVTIVRRPA